MLPAIAIVSTSRGVYRRTLLIEGFSLQALELLQRSLKVTRDLCLFVFLLFLPELLALPEFASRGAWVSSK